MWVSRVAKWPPARVAIQPPRVAYSKDCGKWRRVSPCSRSCSSSRGPVAPAWIRAASEAGSTSSTRSSRRRSIVTTGRSPEPRLDPADDAGAAAERDHRGALGLGPAQHRLDLGLVARAGDQVGRVLELAAEARARRRGRPCPAPARRARTCSSVKRSPNAVGPLQPRRPQLDLLQRHRLLDLAAEPEALADPFRRLAQLRRRRRLVLIPPPPMLEPPLRHRASYRRRPTSGRLSSGARRRRPRSRAPCRGPPRLCPSPPASRGRACRRC